jgi:hypothetical protein
MSAFRFRFFDISFFFISMISKSDTWSNPLHHINIFEHNHQWYETGYLVLTKKEKQLQSTSIYKHYHSIHLKLDTYRNFSQGMHYDWN